MTEKHVLPIVVEICQDIDKLFLRYVGPVGALLCKETFQEWSQEHRGSMLEIPYYIDMLAAQIPKEDKQVEFTSEAMHHISDHISV